MSLWIKGAQVTAVTVFFLLESKDTLKNISIDVVLYVNVAISMIWTWYSLLTNQRKCSHYAADLHKII